VGDQDETIEALRRDLFTATANRGLVYTAILREMRKELGEERASQIFKRAIFDHGAKMAGFLRPPDQLEEFKEWLLAFLPDGGAMNEPEVMRCDEDGPRRCLRPRLLRECLRLLDGPLVGTTG
jgi:hypothetical protein